MKVETEEGPPPVDESRAFSTAVVEGAGTLFTWTVETWGAAVRLGGPLAGLATKRELAANAGRLKELLEGEPAACPNE